jgi:hypothetical protein
MRQIILKILIIVVLILIINEIIQTYIRQIFRKKLFLEAENLSKILKRPLMVIGDPYNGIGSKFHGPAYGCGDICLDITGCPKCNNGIKGRLEDKLSSFKSNSHVIYISCVLEYVDEIDKVWEELLRIAGTSKNIFMINVSGYCLTAYLYKEQNYKAKRVIHRIEDDKLIYTNIKN